MFCTLLGDLRQVARSYSLPEGQLRERVIEIETRYSGYWKCYYARHRGNVDMQMPLDSRAPGSAPPFSDADREDPLAFLKTVTDDAFIAAPSL